MSDKPFDTIEIVEVKRGYHPEKLPHSFYFILHTKEFKTRQSAHKWLKQLEQKLKEKE